MKQIIAYGAWGKNLTFDRKQDAMDHFGIKSQDKFSRFMQTGDAIRDPKTNQEYFLDELEIDEREEAE